MLNDRDREGTLPLADPSRGERALLVSDLEDRLEVLDRAERKWALWTIPSILVVAVALFVVFVAADIIPVSGAWILANVLIVLGVLAGGRRFVRHKRRALEEERASLCLLAGVVEERSLPESLETDLPGSADSEKRTSGR